MFARYEAALAGLLAEETGAAPGSAEPFVAAAALVAVLRASFEATVTDPKSAKDEASRAIDMLAVGLASYAVSGRDEEGPGTAGSSGTDAARPPTS